MGAGWNIVIVRLIVSTAPTVIAMTSRLIFRWGACNG